MKRREIILFTLAAVLIFSVFAVMTATPVRAEKKPTYIPLLVEGGTKKGEKRKKIKVEEDKKEETEIPVMVGAGGGFFSALGSMNDDLQPGFFTGKVFLQYYRQPVSPFGAGLEVSTAYLKDREIDGGMLYFHSIPYLCLNFEPFGILEVQGRMGGGMTWLRSNISTGTGELLNNSYDFTFYAGFAAMKTFAKHYMVGAEAVVYYYFERNPSASYGLNIIFGYHL